MTKEKFSPYRTLDYIKTDEELETYVQERIRAAHEPATTPVATPGRCEGYAAVEMPDGFKVRATANTQIEAGTLLLEQLKTHYGRHFRLTDSNGTVICTTENRSDD